MEVSAYDPFLAPGTVGHIRVEHDLTAALGMADFVTIHAPKTGGALIGAPEIARMKRGAVLVSAARGGQVDEVALVEALRSGQAAAVVDRPPSRYVSSILVSWSAAPVTGRSMNRWNSSTAVVVAGP